MIVGNDISGIKACPYCGSIKTVISNPFVSDGQINGNYRVLLFVFCENCEARGPVIRANVGVGNYDFAANIANAKRDAIAKWNSVMEA
jgi:Lar family restriction alleviation protein